MGTRRCVVLPASKKVMTSNKYCSVKCQREHWPRHKKECKKRAAELRDELLFKQPESTHRGDCPICCLPMPTRANKSIFYACCFKAVCRGCAYATMKPNQESTCPFCRYPIPNSEETKKNYLMKRVEANDPVAISQLGMKHQKKGDYKRAFEYYTKAVGFGDIDAHMALSFLYEKELGVEKDEKKRIYHLEEAAIGGHADARFNLGNFEGRNKRYNRATKHFIIAANLGHDLSLELLKVNHAHGSVSKEELSSALRGHKAAVDAMKSSQREEAEVVRQKREAARAAQQK